MLAARHLGLEPVGLEPDRAHSRIAREILGFNVVTDYFNPGLFHATQFDLVMLSHVIEHIYEPRRFIEDVAQIVRKGGMLIIHTPNADCVASLAMGKWWPMLKTPDHVSMLTPRTIPFIADPATWTIHTESDEAAWETPAAVIAGMRDACSTLLRPQRDSDGGNTSTGGTHSFGVQWNPSLSGARRMLALAGSPLRVVARKNGRASNVIAYLIRR